MKFKKEMSLKYKYSVLSLLFLLFFPLNNTQSHPIKDIHKLCLEAKDYRSCYSFQQKLSQNYKPMINTNNQKRVYGPITLDWSSLTSKEDTYITTSTNSTGQEFFIAINCKYQKINVTGKNKKWKKWNHPINNFEFKLIKDVCFH